jgi:hypothetical protein
MASFRTGAVGLWLAHHQACSTEAAHEISYADVKDAFDVYEQALYQQQYYNDIVSKWVADETW